MDDLDKLYKAVSAKLNIGTAEEFRSKMGTPEERARFFDAVAQRGFDLGDRDVYEQRLSGVTTPTKTSVPVQEFSAPSLDYQSNLGLSTPSEGLGSSLTNAPTQEDLTDHAVYGGAIQQGQARRLQDYERSFEGSMDDIRELSLNRNADGINREYPTLSNRKNIFSEWLGGFNNFVNTTVTGASKVPALVYDVIADFTQNPLADLTGIEQLRTSSKDFAEKHGLKNPIEEALRPYIDARAEYVQNNLGDSVSEMAKSGNYLRAARLLSNQIAESLPFMIVAGTTGGAGMFALGTTASAERYSELQRDTDPKVSSSVQLLNSIIHGYSDPLFAKVSTVPTMNVAKELYKRGGRKLLEREGPKVFNEAYKDLFRKYFVPVSSVSGGIEETAIQLTKNAADILTGVNPDAKLSDGLVDAAIVGVAMPLTISAPTTVISRIRTKTKVNESSALLEMIDEQLHSPGISETSREVLTEQRAKVEEDISQTVDAENKAVEALSEKDLKRAEEISEQIDKIQEVIDDPNVSDEVKAPMIAELSELNNELDSLLESPAKDDTEAALEVLDKKENELNQKNEELKPKSESEKEVAPENDKAPAKPKEDSPEPKKEEATEKPDSLKPQDDPNFRGVTTINTDDIVSDPDRFQFKEDDIGEDGVSDKLKGANYNPELAGVVSVWRDPADGKTYVINGHHRLNLAKANNIKAMDVRYISAKNASEARIKGAMQNIAEGQGTDLDAAKLMREKNLTGEALENEGIKLTSAIASNALALSKLSDGIFRQVVNGTLPKNVGVIIGKHIPSHGVQEQFFNQIKGKNLSQRTIEVMAQDMSSAPVEKQTVADLFGTTVQETAKYEERAKVISYIRSSLSRAKNLLGKVANSKAFLEQYGNKIDAEVGQGTSREAATALAVFDTLRNSDPTLKQIVDKAVKDIENGRKRSEVESEASRRIIEEVERILRVSGERTIDERAGKGGRERSESNNEGRGRVERQEEGGKGSREGENEILQRGTQEEQRGSDSPLGQTKGYEDRLGRRIEEAGLELKRPLNKREIEDIERKVAYEYATENDIWIEDLYSLGSKPMRGGNENTLVVNEGEEVVYKSNNLFNSENSISRFFENIKAHNTLFPHSKYIFVGFTGLKGDGKRVPYIEPIVKQRYLADAKQATQSEIDAYMKSVGLEKVNNTTFKNKEFTVSDIRPRNVLKDSSGNIHVIDDIVTKNQKAKKESVKQHPSTPKEKALELLDKKEAEVTRDANRLERHKPRKMASLVETFKKVFSLDQKKAESAAKIQDRVVKAMADRAGISKTEIYDAINYVRADAELQKRLKEAKNDAERRKIIGGALFQIIGSKGALNLSLIAIGNRSRAKKLLQEGKSPEDVFRETGWRLHERKDGGKEWKMEIPDGKVKNTDKITNLLNEKMTLGEEKEVGTLGDIYDAPLLFEAYPELKNTKVAIYESEQSNERGGYDPDSKTIYFGRKYYAEKVKENAQELRGRDNSSGVDGGGEKSRSRRGSRPFPEGTVGKGRSNVDESIFDTLLHEVQHAVQSQEGFEGGSNFSIAAKELYSKHKEAVDSAIKEAGRISFAEAKAIERRIIAEREGQTDYNEAVYQQYLNAGGEVESRAVQSRANMSPEERATTLFQQIQGAVQFLNDMDSVIYALTDPNVSTPMHELAHVYERYLTDSELSTIEEWSGEKRGTTAFSEAFAEGFESYLQEGKAPESAPKKERAVLQKIFDNFRGWLNEIYNGIQRRDLNKPMREIYDAMLAYPSKEAAVKNEEFLNKKPTQEESSGADEFLGNILFQKNGNKAGIPLEVNRQAIEAMRGAIKGGTSLQGALDLAHKFLQEQGMSKKQADAFVTDMKESFIQSGATKTELKKTPPPTLKQIIKENTDRRAKAERTIKEIDLIRNQMRDMERGYREGMKKGVEDQKKAQTERAEALKEAKDKVIELVEAARKNGEFKNTSISVRTFIKAVRDLAKANTPKKVENVLDYVQNTLNDAAYEAKLDKAKRQIKRIQGMFFKGNSKAVKSLLEFYPNSIPYNLFDQYIKVKNDLSEGIANETEINNLVNDLTAAGALLNSDLKSVVDNSHIDVPDDRGEDKRSWSKKFLDSATKFIRKEMDIRRGLTKEQFLMRERAQGAANAEMADAVRTARKLEKILKEYSKVKPEEVDSALRGDQVALNSLPDSVAEVVTEMRAHIDRLSQQLVDEGVISESSRTAAEANLGEYLHRSYALHHSKGWTEGNLPKEIRNRAYDYFYQNNKKEQVDRAWEEVTDEYTYEELKDLQKDEPSEYQKLQRKALDLAHERTKNIANAAITEVFEKQGKGRKSKNDNSADAGSLKYREDIAPEIRALMGEFHDPVVNYMKTVSEVASLHYMTKYLNDVKNAGMGTIFFEDAGQEGFNTKISNEGSGSLSPLNGLYTSPELAEAFSQVERMMGSFERFALKSSAVVKSMKTIYSLGTHIKNIEGNIGFILVNGHFDVTQFSDATRGARSEWSKLDNKAFQDIVRPLIENNVLGQNVNTAELRSMMDEEVYDFFIKRRENASQPIPKNILNKLIRKGNLGVDAVRDFAERSYEMEDAFFKIYGFLNDLNRYSTAVYGKSYKDLNPAQRAEHMAEMAELVKNSYPTYSRIPKVVQRISKLPFGNFIGFASESYRIGWNSAARALKEVRSANPKIRMIGAQRMAGIASYAALQKGILSLAASGIGGVWGIFADDEEEKQLHQDALRYVAPWSKNSDILVYPVKDGVMEYFDLSSYDPFGMQWQITNAMMRGEDPMDKVVGTALQFLEPFTDEDLALQIGMNLYNNEDNYGRKIFLKTDKFHEKAFKVLSHAAKAAEPGTVSSIRRQITKDDSRLTDFIYRNYKQDISIGFNYKIRDFNDYVFDGNTSIRQAKNKFGENSAEALKVEQEINEKVNQRVWELRKDWEAGLRLGAEHRKMKEVLATSRLKKQYRRVILTGKE